MELITPGHWCHVNSVNKPADCASQGLFPSELLQHSLWWNEPEWLHVAEVDWPAQPTLIPAPEPTEEKDISMVAFIAAPLTLPIIDTISSFTRLKRVMSWIIRFINNCKGAGNRNLRVAIKEGNQSRLPYSARNPVILPGSHTVTMRAEHQCLLHAGPTLVAAAMGRRFYILGARRIIQSITCACVTCRRTLEKTKTSCGSFNPRESIRTR